MKRSISFAALAGLAGVCLLGAAQVDCASPESMQGLMQSWTVGYSAHHPDAPAKVTLQAAFSADFVEPLARGEVAVAAFAREWFPAERQRYRELTGEDPLLIPVATGSRATKGGTHAIMMFVNEKNPLTRLSREQLQAIWADEGKITTWGQLGLRGEWADRKISLHGMLPRRATGNPPGIVNFLESRLLEGRSWRKDMHAYADLPDGPQALAQIVTAVAADELAIGYSGLVYQVPGVKVLSLADQEGGPYHVGTEDEISRREYPLCRTLYLAIPARPSLAALNFTQYVLGPEGQGIIARDAQGFFPLSASTQAPVYQPHELMPVQEATYLQQDGAIRIVGYNDMAEMLDSLCAHFSRRQKGFRFDLDLRGTRTAPPALANGTSAFAPMGAEFSPTEAAAFRKATGADPLMVRIAHCSLNPRALSGPLAIFVSEENSLPSISLPEVADIFSGRNTRGLQPVGLEPDTALALSFHASLPNLDLRNPAYKGFKQSAEVTAFVAAHPQAIGFAAAMRQVPGVKILPLSLRTGDASIALTTQNLQTGRYPLDRYLMIYVRTPVEPWIREFLNLVLSGEGQGGIGSGTLGYLPLNVAEIVAERLKLNLP